MACPRETGQYGDAIALAQEYARRPACDCVEGDTITNSADYHHAVVEYLTAHGFCALFDGEEIAVKQVNTFSEQWDIESAGRRVIRMYAATCRPAWSAIPPGGAPVPMPTPSPAPTPSPCVPTTTTIPFACPAGTVNTCWRCADRIAWDLERGNWSVLPGSTLLYNDIGGDPNHREYLDRMCNYVRRDGSIIRTAEQQYGVACVDGNAICPPSMVVTTPCPAPTPPPTGTQCPRLECLGVYLHTVICDGVISTNPDGSPKPARGCRHTVDATALFGGCGPNYRCDAECDIATSKNGCCNGLKQLCEDPRGPLWKQETGPAVACEQGERTWLCSLNNLGPGDYSFVACGDGWTDRRGVPNPNQLEACGPQRVRWTVP